MEKLELKHLAPYLPYGLKVGKHFENEFFSEEMDVSTMMSLFNDTRKKPILRPLIDLTVCGNSENIFKDLSDKAYLKGMSDENWDDFCSQIRMEKGYDLIPHWIYQDLIKNHFDVFGLIEKGLAIDINTLTNK